MSQNSSKLNLPYIQQAQAQKHVTHNQAVEVLDAVTQLNVVQFDAADPPSVPAAGATYALGATPTGAWAGHPHEIASHTGSGWMFLTPATGWRAWGEGALRAWDGSDWVLVAPPVETLDQLGINATATPTDRLSVAANSTLLNHDGAGHQLKLNKASAGDTASVLFQSDWAGHAEMGLSGDTNFAVKVSPDGSNWVSPLTIDSSLQTLTIAPDGTAAITVSSNEVRVDQLITGNAVQADKTDATAGRVMTTGAFGLGAPTPKLSDIDVTDSSIATGLYHVDASGPTSNTHHVIHTQRTATGGEVQLAIAELDGAMHIRTRDTLGWHDWQQVATSGHFTGDMSDPDKSPIFERGRNANGDYTRLADGTQICWHSVDLDYSWARELFNTWSFPAVFSSAAKVVCSVDYTSLQAATEADQISTVAVEGPTTANCHFRLMRAAGQTDFITGDTVSVTALAIGRWQ